MPLLLIYCLRCSRLEETVETLRNEKRELMNSKQQFREELLLEKDNARRGYENRLTTEISKLQRETALELSQIRDAQTQVHETEVASLKERLSSTQDQHQTTMVSKIQKAKRERERASSNMESTVDFQFLLPSSPSFNSVFIVCTSQQISFLTYVNIYILDTLFYTYTLCIIFVQHLTV